MTKPQIKLVKVVLAVLLFLCLLDMPYGYYQFLRFVSFAVFGILAYQAYEKENKTEVILYLVLALLFQPFIKIALGRTIWNVVDVVVGFWLLYDVLIKQKGKSLE
ncbi:DUF6804 family protein [Bizionia myxarmorum]|uniref:Uncharacterized protein n=1 Tax=Bizionia myxarmorum TaxID=291186 RepID=A0A5D0QZG6_9FLAO|nr:DUF6804 family protein [Bizionia myxarmorum]TYB74051.1 hypothetical protein ES674_14970 [Bizionia myxarmorum]